jgi:hypothetical protein
MIPPLDAVPTRRLQTMIEANMIPVLFPCAPYITSNRSCNPEIWHHYGFIMISSPSKKTLLPQRFDLRRSLFSTFAFDFSGHIRYELFDIL